MTFECKLKDIRTNAAVWEMAGRAESEMRCTVLNREDYEHAYKLDKFYRTENPTDEREYIQNILEQNVFYLYGRIFVYDFRVMIPALKGYFQIGYDRTYILDGENISDDVLLYYAEGSDTPEVMSRGELYDMAISFMTTDSDVSDSDETECIIEAFEHEVTSVKCRLDDMFPKALVQSVKPVYYGREMICNNGPEVNDKREGLYLKYRSSSQYLYNYLVRVPALGLVFRYGEEIEMEWNWQDETEAEGGHVEFIDDLMMVYNENTETWNFTFEGIRKTVRRYIAEHELPIEDPSTLECIIEVNV